MTAFRFTAVAVIGFGEAGPVFARGMLSTGAERIAAYDILSDDQASAPTIATRCREAGAKCASTIGDALSGAELVISTVTADQTTAAAVKAAKFLTPGQYYLDLNSTSPRQKRLSAEAVHRAGAKFVEGVAMDTVPNYGHRVPLLLAGPWAAEVLPRLLAHDMKAEVAGPEFGQACSVKLLRSILIKGLEALFAESMAAAGQLGIQQRIIDTLYVTYPGLDWNRLAGYHLSRIAIHGRRRAAEMEASAETVQDLGIEPIMASAIARRHAWAANAGLRAVYTESTAPTVGDYLQALAEAGVSEHR